MKRAPRSQLRTVLADNMRRLRAERNWSQERLADEAKFSRSYLAEIETGARNVSLDNIARLAIAFGVSPKELLDDGHK